MVILNVTVQIGGNDDAEGTQQAALLALLIAKIKDTVLTLGDATLNVTDCTISD